MSQIQLSVLAQVLSVFLSNQTICYKNNNYYIIAKQCEVLKTVKSKGIYHVDYDELLNSTNGKNDREEITKNYFIQRTLLTLYTWKSYRGCGGSPLEKKSDRSDRV